MPLPPGVVMVALLPIPIRYDNIPQRRQGEQWHKIRAVQNEVVQQVPQPLTCKQNASTESRYLKVRWAHSNFRHCQPVLAARLADCLTYSVLHHLKRHVGFWCECPKNQLGDNVPPDKPHPQQDHNLFRMLSDANTKAADAQHPSRHDH